ncbi:UxaA family hydrolase [Cohnella yongneupensis]|uniref:UxaA family hydrolase n=1 Tax=Cohnella yongneupensis TaxID=425006 RepID=A0ABW0QXI4_9BACL
MSDTVILHPDDDVAVALRDIAEGEAVTVPAVDGELIVQAIADVPRGHKLAIRPIGIGSHVRKFGYSIGVAQSDIPAGSWVHTHNVRTGLGGLLDYRYEPKEQAAAQPQGRSFLGYERDNGEVGIRNEIWILNTVGCINKTCELLAKMATNRFAGRGIDGIFHFAHPFGCSQLGDDLSFTKQLLASLAEHGNAAGVLIVGLGCENNQIAGMRELLGDGGGRIRFLKSQEEEDELEAGMLLLEELVAYAERFVRKPIPLSKLKLGLKCGGSDGFSGITANPLVGRMADIVTAEGGTALLTEVPEMFGAETILMNRAEDEEVFGKVVNLINDFKQYFIRHNQEIYENPSPGNKAGGITTLEEKSLGCTQKGGHAQVTDVLPYGVRASKPGLNLIQGPGNDLVSVTALAAAGAHIVLFTTGRGTPFGGPVPTVKLSTNSELAQKKKHWIDFDAGRLLGGTSMAQLTDDLLAYVIGLASGDIKTNGENNGFREIAIFKDGVIL